jgi:predicted DNA-binding antitoxin AbrB/MazE fold protein
MTIIRIQAVYTKGLLKPATQLNLPEGAKVEVQISELPTAIPVSGSLFGAFPQLGLLNDDDVAWAKRLWEHGIQKQSRLLDERD